MVAAGELCCLSDNSGYNFLKNFIILHICFVQCYVFLSNLAQSDIFCNIDDAIYRIFLLKCFAQIPLKIYLLTH